jgi:Uma2 family endonuclease
LDSPAVTASPLVRRYTLDEFFALDPPPGGGHWELIAGVLYMVPPPEWPHNEAASRLVRFLSRYADAHADSCTLYVPRTPIWTETSTYLEPDLFLISRSRLAAIERRRITSAELIVEVHSPGSSVYDRTAKADTYAALGCDELWLVDPEHRTIEQRVLGDGNRWQAPRIFSAGEVVRSSSLPGLEVAIDDVFE